MKTWALHENVDVKCLSEWYHNVMKDCRSNIDRSDRCNRKTRSQKDMILNSPEIKDYLKKLKQDFVFVSTEKASNNITIVCKKKKENYIEQSIKEPDIFMESGQKDLKDKTYAMVDKEVKSIVRRHKNYKLKTLYW